MKSNASTSAHSPMIITTPNKKKNDEDKDNNEKERLDGVDRL